MGSATNVQFPSVYNMEDSEGNTYQYQVVWPLILPQALAVYSRGLECTPAVWGNNAATVTNPNNGIVIVGAACYALVRWQYPGLPVAEIISFL